MFYATPTGTQKFNSHHSNGQLILDLRAGEKKETFKASLLINLVKTQSVASGPAAAPSDPSATSNQRVSGQTPTHTASSSPPVSSSPQENIPTAPSGGPSSAVANLLAERRRKLEIDKKEKDAAEKAERKAKADARKEAINASPDSAKAKQISYAQQQRKRQQEAKLERERVVRQIEQDKVERREKEERRKALARAESESNQNADDPLAKSKNGADGLVDSQIMSENGPKPIKSAECAVQVRLFDGSTIRKKFRSDQTLTELRAWVEKQRSDDLPYTFKQILSPLPNRPLTISEEKEMLQDLGLTPSATLVMVPIQGYTGAYAGAGPGVLSRGASAGYHAVAAGAGLISGALGTFLGVGQATEQIGAAGAQENAASAGQEPHSNGSEPGVNVRTLRDQREEDGKDHQLYNGNQVSATRTSPRTSLADL